MILGQQKWLSPVQGQLLGPGPHSCPGSDKQGTQGCAGATAAPWAIRKGGLERGTGAATEAELQQAQVWDS